MLFVSTVPASHPFERQTPIAPQTIPILAAPALGRGGIAPALRCVISAARFTGSARYEADLARVFAAALLLRLAILKLRRKPRFKFARAAFSLKSRFFYGAVF